MLGFYDANGAPSSIRSRKNVAGSEVQRHCLFFDVVVAITVKSARVVSIDELGQLLLTVQS